MTYKWKRFTSVQQWPFVFLRFLGIKKNYIEKFQNFLEIFFFWKFSEKLFSGIFKKIKNLKIFEWREVKEEVNYSENLASDDLKNTWELIELAI